jgi:hypothetical protein
MRIRTTKGINLVDIKQFIIVDDWTQAANSHRVIEFPWVGNTMFQEVNDSVTLIDTSMSLDSYSKTTTNVCSMSSNSKCNTLSSLTIAYRRPADDAPSPNSCRISRVMKRLEPATDSMFLQRLEEHEIRDMVACEIVDKSIVEEKDDEGGVEETLDTVDDDAGDCAYRCQDLVGESVTDTRSEPKSGILLPGYTGQGFGCGVSACMPTRPLKQYPCALASWNVSHVRGTRGYRYFSLPMMRRFHARPHAHRAAEFYPLFMSFYPSLGDGCSCAVLVVRMISIHNEIKDTFRALAGGSGMILFLVLVV